LRDFHLFKGITEKIHWGQNRKDGLGGF
jgi:hypothetical protein